MGPKPALWQPLLVLSLLTEDQLLSGAERLSQSGPAALILLLNRFLKAQVGNSPSSQALPFFWGFSGRQLGG